MLLVARRRGVLGAGLGAATAADPVAAEGWAGEEGVARAARSRCSSGNTRSPGRRSRCTPSGNRFRSRNKKWNKSLAFHYSRSHSRAPTGGTH
jgi:hypothetical protein